MKNIAPNIYASTEHAGVNVGFIVMPAGVIAIDAPTLPRDARAWRQQIMEVTGGPILYVVLTDGHPDRLLAVEDLCGHGETPVVAAFAAYDRASAYTDGFWRSVVEGWIRRHPEAADELTGVQGALPEILFTSDLTLHKGGVSVTIKQVAGAAPDSAWVYLPEQDVLFAGDTVVADRHPSLAAATNTKAWLDTLTSLRRERFSKTTIVPGRGPICDQSATRPLSDYIALVRRRMRSLRAMHSNGQTRVDMSAVVAELLPFFPVPEDEQEFIQRRIKASLDRVYEELYPE